MKNKKITYLLLVLSIILWGFIGWKFYSAFNYNQPEIPTIKKEIIVNKKDSTTLLLNYRDPFLGKYSSTIVVKDTISPRRKSVVTSSPVKIESIAPQVQYKGAMNIGKTSMAILQKDGKVITIKIGEEIEGYKLIRIDDVKIILSKDRKEYEIPIQ